MIVGIFILAILFLLVVAFGALTAMLVLDLYERIAGHPFKERNLTKENYFAQQKVTYYEEALGIISHTSEIQVARNTAIVALEKAKGR